MYMVVYWKNGYLSGERFEMRLSNYGDVLRVKIALKRRGFFVTNATIKTY